MNGQTLIEQYDEKKAEIERKAKSIIANGLREHDLNASTRIGGHNSLAIKELNKALRLLEQAEEILRQK